MNVSAYANAGLNIYQSISPKIDIKDKEISFKKNDTEDEIKIIRQTVEAPSVSISPRLQANIDNSKNINVKLDTSKNTNLQRLEKEIFSDKSSSIKLELEEKLGINDLSKKAKQIHHYKDSFLENMKSLLTSTNQLEKLNQTAVNKTIRQSLYA